MPVYGDWHAQFGYSLSKMMLYTGASLVADGIIDVHVNMIEGTYLDKARNDLAMHAIKTEATHILWLDCDMKFPQESLMQLIAHGKEIVGCNYPHRRFPIKHTAFKSVSRDGEEHTMLRTTPQSTGLEEVDALGFGMLLMQTSVLKDIEYPWFRVDEVFGEDVFFCNRAKDAGHTVWVDHDLSKQIVHFGPMGYTFMHAEDWIAQEEAEARAKIEEVA